MENQEKRDIQNSEESKSNIQKATLVLSVAMLVSSLSPREVKAADIYSEPTPLIEPLPFYDHSSSVEENKISARSSTFPPVSYDASIDNNIGIELLEKEKMSFDDSILEIENWEVDKMKLKDVELKEKGYTIQVSSTGAEVYSIPLLQSTFVHRRYNDYRFVKNFSVPEGMVYEILEEREIEGINGEIINIGLISNNYSMQRALVIVNLPKLVPNESGKIRHVGWHIDRVVSPVMPHGDEWHCTLPAIALISLLPHSTN